MSPQSSAPAPVADPSPKDQAGKVLAQVAGYVGGRTTNNISMHECRDMAKVTRNIARALKPGGHFVISDFPFPDSDQALRTVPGRIMSGIQFFEAQIEDHLVPVSTYLGLLDGHGFENVGSFELTPVHAVTYGQKAA